ncbi:unnamed protein product [Heterobilharzia americana]|nr:unnamed protein product [Heterobilharzia americana]
MCHGSILQVLSNNALLAYNEIWEFAISLFEQCSTQRNRMEGYRKKCYSSGHRLLNHDRLVCNLLSALFFLENAVENSYFKCSNISVICTRIFRSLNKCLELDACHLNNSPWRVRLMVLSSDNIKLSRNLIPCDAFIGSKIPNVLLFCPCISFLLNNYVKIWNAEGDFMANETTNTEVPLGMSNLLSGILWAYKSLLGEPTPTIQSSNPWFYTDNDLSQPLFSSQDHIEAIDFIRKAISVHTHLDADLLITEENLPILVILLTTELSFIRFKFRLLKSECRYLNELTPFYVVLMKRVLERTMHSLVLSIQDSSDKDTNRKSDFFVQLCSSDCHHDCRRIEVFLKSFEVLLESLAFGIDDVSQILSTHMEQLINMSTTRTDHSTSKECTDVQFVPDNSFKPIVASSQLKQTHFGDEDFNDCNSPVVTETLDIQDNHDSYEEIRTRNSSRLSVRIRLLTCLLLYGLRSNNTSLLRQIHNSLHESFGRTFLDDKESIKWLCKLTENISQSIRKAFCGTKYGCKLSSDLAEVIIFFISSMIDAIRQVLQSVIAHCSQFLRISPVIKLIHSLCQLSDCIVCVHQIHKETLHSETDSWKLIGKHADQLIRTIWSVGSKFSKSLRGFELGPVNCLESWMKLYSAKIIDTRSGPEYCLAPAFQHITPIATFQLANFLQR